MKRSVLIFVLFISIFANSYAQLCIPNAEITTADSVLCIGDSTILSFNPFTVDSTTLSTPIINNNGQDGNMFNVTATNTIRIRHFMGNIANTPNTTTDYYIYYKVGTHVGFENNAAAWTLIAGPVSFNPNAPSTLSYIPVDVNITIPAGQTYAFYLTNTSVISNNNRYHNGVATGTVSATNADLTVYEGTGGAYPFGTFFNARPWEGNIIYDYPVSFLWSTGGTLSSITVSPTTTTDYSCVASTQGCTVEDTINIQASGPTVALGNDTTICNGSLLVLDAGNPGSTYAWCNADVTQTSNVNSAGLQCVTVTDLNGCIGADSIMISTNALPSVVAIVTDSVICENEIITFTGNGASTYLWNNGVSDGVPNSPLISNDYIVTGTDLNNCSNSDTISIVVNPNPGVDITGDSIVCYNDGTDLTASGADSYIWQDGSTTNPSNFNLPISGQVFVIGTISATGCIGTDTIYVVVNSLPVVNLGADIVQPNPPALLDAGSGFSSYFWNDGSTTQTASMTSNGDYYVIVTDVNGCTASDTVNVVFTASIGNMDGSTALIRIYPNPVENVFQLQIEGMESENMMIEILDIKGSLINNWAPQSVSGEFLQTINVETLSPGIYLINIKANGYQSTLRFIKK